MEHPLFLILIGFIVGTIGTLIGAGGGFILVPLLVLLYKDLSAESITAISMAVVACNAISGSVAYVRSGRVDYKAGIIFAVFTIPGSILGVLATKYIPRHVFDLLFSALLLILAAFLFVKGGKGNLSQAKTVVKDNWTKSKITDKRGETYEYAYQQKKGILISVIVGFVSPILGIGGGIIHVPAMVNFLYFPVHIATATSHFILAIMATVSVIVHMVQGNYNDPAIYTKVISLVIGVIAGAQLGAYLSHKLHGSFIIRALAVALAMVGVRILIQAINA